MRQQCLHGDFQLLEVRCCALFPLPVVSGSFLYEFVSLRVCESRLWEVSKMLSWVFNNSELANKGQVTGFCCCVDMNVLSLARLSWVKGWMVNYSKKASLCLDWFWVPESSVKFHVQIARSGHKVMQRGRHSIFASVIKNSLKASLPRVDGSRPVLIQAERKLRGSLCSAE